jgi:hypothetical protein
MGWGFRRSLKLGPLNLNFSKSGMGYSVGARGFRVGKDAKRRSYTAASIPGTGLYSRTYSGQGRASGGNAAGLPSAPAARDGGIALALEMLALAFIAGGLVVFLVMPRPVPPLVTPPAAASAPQAPAQPIPAKRRRVYKPKPASVPLPQNNEAQKTQPQHTP